MLNMAPLTAGCSGTLEQQLHQCPSALAVIIFKMYSRILVDANSWPANFSGPLPSASSPLSIASVSKPVDSSSLGLAAGKEGKNEKY